MNLRVFQIEKREEKILQLTKLFNVYHPYKILETEMVIYSLNQKYLVFSLELNTK